MSEIYQNSFIHSPYLIVLVFTSNIYLLSPNINKASSKSLTIELQLRQIGAWVLPHHSYITQLNTSLLYEEVSRLFLHQVFSCRADASREMHKSFKICECPSTCRFPARPPPLRYQTNRSILTSMVPSLNAARRFGGHHLALLLLRFTCNKLFPSLVKLFKITTSVS